MYNKFKNILLLAVVIATSSVNAQRAGKSITITPIDIPVSTYTPCIIYGSKWSVYFKSYTPLYRAYDAMISSCNIVKTNNSYSVKIWAFNKTFVYVQTQALDLNLTKTETINVSSTQRRIVVWSITTNGMDAACQCTVEVQTLRNRVWYTSSPPSVWLKSYISIADMNTPI